MSKRFKLWLLVLSAILLSRFIGMALFPFVDTTEPRYAEIARLMAETGDWITPWFEPGVPFWGKPPLAFWAQAAAIKVFGLSELTLRLPSWLATVVMVWLTWRFAWQVCGELVARWAALIFATMALTYISAGAVMTDAFLALGTTLSLVSFGLVMSGKQGLWRGLFFVGLVIGLLSKGPLALVLTAIPIVLWLVLVRQSFKSLQLLPWISGTLFTVLLAGPWYLMAELKTPGFLDYFIVGEHIRRFIDPGWIGDLYGSAHEQPKGMIWVFWLWASFPWGILALGGVALSLFRGALKASLLKAVSDHHLIYVLLCALAPMLFFTLAGNTLWTYVLPSLPFTAILIAQWVAALNYRRSSWTLSGALMMVPVVTSLFVAVAASGLTALKTEKELVVHYTNLQKNGDSPLMYLDDVPFSARFYSRSKAREVTEDQLTDIQNSNRYQRIYVAAPLKWPAERVSQMFTFAKTVMENHRYQLLSIDVLSAGQERLPNVEQPYADGW